MSTENLFDFFHDNIQTAHDEVQVDLDPDTVLYLANLLTDRARVDVQSVPETTLAELHGRAAHSQPADKVRVYRELGDRALYRMGFFSESFTTSSVNSQYYSDMGAAAYYQVDRTFKLWFSDAFGPVFCELAERFLECVSILTQVREQSAADHPSKFIRLYQHWLKTGDESLLEDLKSGAFWIHSDTENIH